MRGSGLFSAVYAAGARKGRAGTICRHTVRPQNGRIPGQECDPDRRTVAAEEISAGIGNVPFREKFPSSAMQTGDGQISRRSMEFRFIIKNKDLSDRLAEQLFIF